MDETEVLVKTETSSSPPPAARTGRRFRCIEPIVFMLALAMGSGLPLDSQYIKYRVAKDLSNGSIVANLLANNTAFSDEVDSRVSMWILYITISALTPGCISMIMLASYSDTAGRRYALRTPLLALLVHSAALTVIVHLELPLYCNIVIAVLRGIFGDISTMFAGMYSYIADITTTENRSMRIVIIDIMLGIGMMLSQLAAGYIISWFGFTYCYFCIFLIFLLNSVYTVFFLEESIHSDHKVNFWSFSHFKKAFAIFFSKSFHDEEKAGRRTKMLLCLFICALQWFSMFSKDNVLVLYLLNKPFSMNPIEIGYYGAFAQLVPAISNIILTKLLFKHLRDEGLLTLGVLSSLAFILAIALSPSKEIIFVGPLFGFGFMIVIPMARSMCSKLILKEDEGAMFSVFSLMMSASVMIGMASINGIYAATVSMLPSLVFFFISAICSVNVLLAVILMVFDNKYSGYQEISDINVN